LLYSENISCVYAFPTCSLGTPATARVFVYTNIHTVLARRYFCVLGSAVELTTRLQQGSREPGWERILRPSAVSQEPCEGQGLVEQNMGTPLMDSIGKVLSVLKRTQLWRATVREVLAQLIGYIDRNRTRIRHQEPWYSRLAVGSGAVEGACKHVMTTSH